MVRRGTRSGGKHLCGLYYNVPRYGILEKVYLHQVEINVHASILATTSRTVLQQTFANPSTARGIREVRYAFPLYEGVSVVGFSCLVGNRLIVGEVKEKEKAKQVYQEAVSRGETAGLFEQLPEASDVFTTTIGNIPPGSEVKVTITYLGELKHDMEVDGIRFTIPTSICPRYGDLQSSQANSLQMNGTISVVVDAEMAEGSFIQKLLSPSHPIALSMGTTSVHPNAEPSMNKASATLSLGVAHLETDFILQVVAKDTGVPKAMLETHPTIPNHRALMATLVPKFALPAEKPEVVFVCDQSGSMEGDRIALARSALRVFLRSLPVGVKFNICSFGSRHSFLFPRSVTYGQDTLDQATHYADELAANYGGTEMLSPLKATIENRYKDIPLEIIMLTDGETWNQQSVFNYLNEQIQDNKAPIRVFTLGIGSGVSHALIEGIAKAGNGFAQSVQDGEKMSSKVVRMLKGALSPHVNDYTLEVKYSGVEEDDEFEIVEKVADSLKVKLDIAGDEKATTSQQKEPISLFNPFADPDPNDSSKQNEEDRYAHLPSIPAPKILQAPQSIPTLFAFTRTTVYLLLGPDAPRKTPTSVVLRGTSTHGPLELEIPVQVLPAPGETVHQLAAKKAVSELEQGRGWLASASDANGEQLKTRFDGRFSDMVEREAVRLGVQFQVGGKWCSFVATEKTATEAAREVEEATEGWEFLEDEPPAQPLTSDLEMKGNRYSVDYLVQRNSQMQQQIQQQQQMQQQHMQQMQQQQMQQQHMQQQHMQQQQMQQQQMQQQQMQQPRMLHREMEEPIEAGMLQSHFGTESLPQRDSTDIDLCAGSRTLPPGATSQQRLQPSSSNPMSLQDYQLSLMVCEQQNKNRLKMAREAPPENRKTVEWTFPPPDTLQSAEPWSFPFVADTGMLAAHPGSSYASSGAATPYDLSGPVSYDSPGPGNPSKKKKARVAFGSVGGSRSAGGPRSSRSFIDQEFSVTESYSPTSPQYSPPTALQYSPASPYVAPLARSLPPGVMAQYAPSPSSSSNSPPIQGPAKRLACVLGSSQPRSSAQPSTPEPPPPQNPQTPQEVMHALISHQDFSGAFRFDQRVLGWLGVSMADFEGLKQKSGAASQRDDMATVLLTALAVVYFERRLAEFSDEWELVVEKARSWLEDVGADVAHGFLTAAGELVGDK